VEDNFIVLDLIFFDEVGSLAGDIEITCGSNREVPWELTNFKGAELLQLTLFLLVENHHFVVSSQAQIDPAVQVFHFRGIVQLILRHLVSNDLLELVILVA
jgi:hypothetical protein